MDESFRYGSGWEGFDKIMNFTPLPLIITFIIILLIFILYKVGAFEEVGK